MVEVEEKSDAEPNLQVSEFIRRLEFQGVEKGEIIRSLLKLGYNHNVILASFETASKNLKYSDFENQENDLSISQTNSTDKPIQGSSTNPLEGVLLVLFAVMLVSLGIYFLLPFVSIDFGNLPNDSGLPLHSTVAWDENVFVIMQDAMVEIDDSLGATSMSSAKENFLVLERESEKFRKMDVPQQVIVSSDFESARENFLEVISNLKIAISQNNFSNSVFYLKKLVDVRKEILVDFKEAFVLERNLFLTSDFDDFGLEEFPSSFGTVKLFVSGQRPMNAIERNGFFDFPYRNCGDEKFEMLLLVSENYIGSVDVVKNVVEFSKDLEIPFEVSALKKSFYSIDSQSDESSLLALYKDINQPVVLVINCNKAIFDLSSKQAIKEGVCEAVKDLEFC
ncbi:MAG: hypothetical protein KAS30_04910 [Candidatus Diapherotrites archaeon]|nr:hypothetical protein [Candidatus Diapherotrites archaeon]